jgi:hypothetical protein
MRELPAGPGNSRQWRSQTLAERLPRNVHDLKRPLKKGESVKVTLVFEHAGTVPVEFQVGGVGDTPPGGGSKSQNSMKGMKM